MKILAVTPIKPGTILAPYSLSIERMVSEIAPCNRIREIDININRARLQSFVRNIYARAGITHILLLDSDVVATEDTLEKLKSAWKPGTTACAKTQGDTGHILASFALLHVDDYLQIDYLSEISCCQCTKVPNPFYVNGAETSEMKR